MQLFSATVSALIITLVANLFVSKSHSQTTTNDFKVEFSRKEGEKLTQVRITCFNNLWTKYPDVKHDMLFVSEVEFSNCSFPATVNVQNIIHSINIDTFSQVKFAWFGSIPSRQSLKGLSTHHLNFENIDFTEVPFDLLYDVDKVGFLQISYANIAHIPEQFFSDWAKDIMKVDLHINALQKITTNDFVRLLNVNSIDLSENRIEVIEPGAFDSLIHLHTLKLESNKLQTLPNGIFHQTTSLAWIGLNNNSFDELPHDMLVNTKKLEFFAMSANKGNFTTVAPGFFKNLTQLKTVELYSNQIQNLPANLFAGCSALNYVDLGDNQLRNLPSGLFDNNENLADLYLGKNFLESLPAGIFKNLNRLKELHIDGNRLTSLTSENLEGLNEISIFDASHNNLTRIDDHFIVYLKSANEINLSHNQLTFDSRGQIELSENENRSSLSNNLNKTSISTSENQNILPCEFDRNIEYISLNLRNNNITKLNAKLINVIRYNGFVDLSHNRITKINLSELSSGFALCNRTNTGKAKSKRVSFYVGHNPLHCDCNIADMVNYLNRHDDDEPYDVIAARYDSSRKGFRCVSPPEFENREVRDIRLDELNCLIKTTTPEDACDETCICREYPGIQVLSVDCSQRNLTRFPSMIGNTHNWPIELNMTGNMLQQTPSLRDSYLTSVTTLDLSNNNITRITLELFSPSLQQLRLHGNSISRLDSDVIGHLSHSNNTFRSITLYDNKWICDCQARQLITFVQKKLANYDLGEMRCYGTNRKLYKMTASELCEDTIVIIVIASLSVAFLGIVVASLVALYYKYQREIKVWLYSKQWCLWFVTEDELDKDKEYDAFISFSHEDEDFVEKEIIAKLEGGPRPYKLCLHYRDWLAGEWIPLQISRSVAESRRTIVVLTPNFLESVWGLIEFRTAHIQALKEGRARLIVIICGEIGNIDDLDQEMKDYLRLNTYIKWGDPWFWDKLRYALPHSKEPIMRKSQKADVKKPSTQLPVTNDIDTNADRREDVISMPMHTVSTNDSIEVLNPCPQYENLITSSL